MNNVIKMFVWSFIKKILLKIFIQNLVKGNKQNIGNHLNHLRIDRNFCSVHEEITSIRFYTPRNPRSGLRKGVYNLIVVISKERVLIGLKSWGYFPMYRI
jgi:hypothetical protein